MRRTGAKIAAAALAAVTWCAAVGNAPAASPLPSPEPLVTSAVEFDVPFAIDLQEAVAQVELLVSSDRGRSWNGAQIVKPTAGKFLFRAPFDGEFWFFIRTVDAQGKIEPTTLPEAEMKVIVAALDRAQFVSVAAPIDGARGGEGARTVSNETPVEEAFTLPRGALRPRMVNSRTVDIDYEAPADQRAPREIAVWLTRDGGQSWQRNRIDEDLRSPVRVTVDADGLYGLWIVMTDADGQRGVEPRPGDEPGAWVGVDTLSPRVQLLTADAHQVRGQREFTVRWEANDARLSLAPVTLSYRRSPDEPWAILATRLLNTGSHSLPLAANAPERIQLRLEVLDEAGNLGVFETTEPVSTIPRESHVGPRDSAILSGSRTYQVLR